VTPSERSLFVNEHSIPAYDAGRLAAMLGEVRSAALGARLGQVAASLAGKRLVNVTGDDRRKGGVYEIMRGTLPYLRGAGVEVIWVDLPTPPEARPALEFFHVLAHGRAPSANWRSDLAERALEFESFGKAAAAELKWSLAPSDLVVLHDTQTAPVVPELQAWRDRLVWHAHIGTADRNELVDSYWQIVGPKVAFAGACVFYRPEFAPGTLSHKSVFASPGLDPSTPKSALMELGTARAVLGHPSPKWPLAWVSAPGPVVEASGLIGLQLSRWDPLKDMPGAFRVFAQIAERNPLFMGMVVGPSAQSAAERKQLDLCIDEHDTASLAARSQVHIGVIEQCGTDEHDQAVRVLQSAADIIVQKSVQEGFGLTVTEAMLRGKPVIATAVGGIPLQLQDGLNGILVEPDADDETWATRLDVLAADAELRSQLGTRARADVLHRHTVDRQLTMVVEGVARLLSAMRPNEPQT
jgi:trehalose synthase